MAEDRLEEHIEVFRALGGEFWTPVAELKEKILRIHGIIFDWDGVFHIGQKGEGQCGVFSEADSMGTNMIRYCYWRKYHEQPFMAIISGQKDKTAAAFAEREHFHVVYTGIADKKDALDHACAVAGIEPLQVACIFDDINDLSMVKHCGLKIQVRRAASPLFMEYTKQHGLCDYITGHPAQLHAVREFCELFLGLCGNYQDVIASRTAFDSDYQAYWKARNEIKTNFYSKSTMKIK